MKNKKLKLLSFLLVSFSFFIDQIAKFLVLKNIDLFSSGIKVFIGLNLVYVENKGVSFGLFSDYNIPFYLGILSQFVIQFLTQES